MKRRKTIRAGRLVWDITYTVPRPNASKQERKRIREVTEEQVARTNANTAQRKLEMLMATNFDDTDLVLTVTYRDADLPDSADVTRKHLGKVFAQMRAYRKARGLPDLKYIYVLEGRHGDHRPHAHLIVNAAGGDLELMRSLWIWGDDIQLNYIRERGYDGWAGYLTKERREASLNGKKQFVGSRNLDRPVTTYAWVDDGTTVDAPPGAQVLDEGGGRNEIASCRFVKYLMPKNTYYNTHATRTRTRVVAGLECSITFDTRMEKRKRTGRHRRSKGV
ncbi:rolling circle replication-associated protein [Agathobaculum sp.]|uniref:rolling circle replication-associated protein n=1 Tax=Agathobaculum sp. TaxID=2048138 RepID=UPI003AB7E67E